MTQNKLNWASPKNLWIEIFISIRFYKNDRFYYNNTTIKLKEKNLWISENVNRNLKKCDSWDSNKKLRKIFIQVFKLWWDLGKNLSKIEWASAPRDSFSSRLLRKSISRNYHHRYGINRIYYINDSYHFRSDSSNSLKCNHIFQEIQHLCNIKFDNRLRGWWLSSCWETKDSEMQCTSNSKASIPRCKFREIQAMDKMKGSRTDNNQERWNPCEIHCVRGNVQKTWWLFIQSITNQNEQNNTKNIQKCCRSYRLHIRLSSVLRVHNQTFSRMRQNPERW